MRNALNDSQKKSFDIAKRFGYEWQIYSRLDKNYEEQFINWIHPFNKAGFHSKDVCDAGCGMGRNAYWALKYGAKSVLAFDAAQGSVVSAKNTLKEFPNAQVELLDIYRLNRPNSFDICMSIGVIHHLEHPRKAVESLVYALRPGGQLIVWLYGYEGNELYVNLFRLIHPVMKRIHPGIVHGLTYLFSIPLFVLIKAWPFQSEYIQRIRKFSFPHLHSIVFDQLLPRISKYYKRSEVEALFYDVGLGSIQIEHNSNYSWTVIGVKAGRQ